MGRVSPGASKKSAPYLLLLLQLAFKMSVYSRAHVSGAPDNSAPAPPGDDDWETDDAPANLVSEREQRWGSAMAKKPEVDELVSMDHVRETARQQHENAIHTDRMNPTGGAAPQQQVCLSLYCVGFAFLLTFSVFLL